MHPTTNIILHIVAVIVLLLAAWIYKHARDNHEQAVLKTDLKYQELASKSDAALAAAEQKSVTAEAALTQAEAELERRRSHYMCIQTSDDNNQGILSELHLSWKWFEGDFGSTDLVAPDAQLPLTMEPMDLMAGRIEPGDHWVLKN
jgi:hypothetical protein